MLSKDIQIRDPYIYTDELDQKYYMFGTTDPDPWRSPGIGFDVYSSTDLENWHGPVKVFSSPDDFPGTTNFWAPEMHMYKGCAYLFATFIGDGIKRGTYVLKSESGGPLGPFVPLSNKSVTPEDWQCLDGTLHVDESGQPWLVFCHEWVEVNDGQICACKLSDDLSRAIEEPVVLFTAGEASWSRAIERRDGSALVDAHVTDGPFLYRHGDGSLIMLWSTLGKKGYAMGYARSATGSILGPWVQSDQALLHCDGGHGMIFSLFDGRKAMTYHSPNKTPNERFHYAFMRETPEGILADDSEGCRS